MKKLALVIVAAFALVVAPFPVFAQTDKNDDKSWVLVDENGQIDDSTPELSDESGSEECENDEDCIPPTEDDCAKLKLNEIGVYVDRQYIEILNPTDETINAENCGIAESYYNKEHILPKTEIAPRDVHVIFLDQISPKITLIKTRAAIVSLLNANGEEVDYIDYDGLTRGDVLAFVGDDWTITKNPTPGVANPPPKPVNLCEGLRLSEIGANLDEQFIEILNPTDHEIDLSGCRIMTNRSTTKFYEFGAEILPAGALKIIKISDTNLALTKSTTGAVYLLASDGKVEIDAASYENLAKNTSWALVGETWLQTFAITRGGVNLYQEFPVCQAGYYRNLETGRCNKNPEPDVLKSCPAGQYRHPETGRCRNLIAAGSTLTPCAEGYERNPLTNRCRKIAANTDESKECAEGYERNPETNRCRKSVSSAPAGFGVKLDPPAGSNLWQWAIGGIMALTFTVVILPFRAEMGRTFQKLFQKFSRQKLEMERE